MITYPQIDPVAIHLGPLAIHWYGLMYLFGFLGGWCLLSWRIRTQNTGFNKEQLSDLLFYIALGVVLGGRIGYVLFYDWANTIANPLHIFEIWKGGMSFHGGLLGVVLAAWLYARRYNKSIFEVGDFVAPTIPIGSALGRIGNFINDELWGRTTDVPWGIVFPNAGSVPRHPSQIYEFFLEGIVLFTILFVFTNKQRPLGSVSGLFLILYGTFRFFVEFFREPDVQIGYVAWGWMTKGQLLSIPMIIIGLMMFVWAYRRKPLCNSI
jgi:phosphatidylglycerol:prolipoprotein diacylglycerol transferase